MTDGTNDEDPKVAKMRREFEAFMLSGKKKKENPDDNNCSDPPSRHLDASYQSKQKKTKKKAKQSFGDATTTGDPRVSNDDDDHHHHHEGIDENSTPPTTLGSSATLSTIVQRSRSRATIKKRYFQLLRSFNDKIQHNWLDTDDQILSIIENIVNIRARLPIEWKVLRLASSQSSSSAPSSSHRRGMHLPDDFGNFDDANFHRENDETMNDDRWKYCGFLGKPKEMPYSSVHLHIGDIQLALSNDLMQHEKMLVEIRKLMAQLAECHDAVGRVVDTLWHFHLGECCSLMARGDEEQDEAEIKGDDVDMDLGSHIVQIVTEVFQMLSMELHKKQKIVPLIIESTKDELLGLRKDETEFMSRNDKGVGMGHGSDDDDSGSGLRTARMCCKVWKRSSDESCVDMNLLAHLFNLGGGEYLEER